MEGHDGSVFCLSWRIVRQLCQPCQGSGTLVEGEGVERLVSGCPLRQATPLLELSVLCFLLPGLVDWFLSEGGEGIAAGFSHRCPQFPSKDSEDYYS